MDLLLLGASQPKDVWVSDFLKLNFIKEFDGTKKFIFGGFTGTGPTVRMHDAPVLNSWFDDHRIRVKSVSCGRYHTLALTENGVYAWGSCKFGQLGVGHLGQTVHPRLVETLSTKVIVSVAAGQYHSLAVDVDGK